MSTRRAKHDEPLAQQKYSSSPEFVDQRGLNGNLVAARSELLRHPAERSLLLFLQALSVERGLARLAEDILAAFPERIGSPTMHKIGIDPKRRVAGRDVESIREELGGTFGMFDFPLKGESDLIAASTARELDELDFTGPRPQELKRKPDFPASYPMADFIKVCEKRSRGFQEFIKDICLNPKQSVRSATLHYFHDVIGALFKFQSDYASCASENFAMTSACVSLFKALRKGTRPGRITFIEGREGVGKTEGAKAWCRAHPGQARYVNLVGITNRTTFFRTVAKALGVGAGYSRMANDMQSRVEDMLHRSKLMLVIDEAQYCLPPGDRITKQPELINWIYTACSNFDVPVALISTSIFGQRIAKLEEQVAWNAGQFKRRVTQYVPLPEVPTRADLEAVARKHLPGAGSSLIKLAVGYAGGTHFPLSNLVEAIVDARDIAIEAGRSAVTYEDLEAAVYQCRMPSDSAKANAFTVPARAQKRRYRPIEPPIETPVETELGQKEKPINRLSGVALLG